MRWGALDLTDDLLRRRLKARAIDMGLVLAPVAVLQFAVALFWRMIGEDSWGSPNYFDFSDMSLVFAYFYVTCVFLPVLPAAVVIVEVVVARKNGQTLGKRQARIWVRSVGEEGVLSAVSVGRVTARAAVLYVPPAVVATVAVVLYGNGVPGSLAVLGAVPVYVIVANLPVLFASHRRGLHDLVAGTVVVVAPASSAGVQLGCEPASARSATRLPRIRFSLGLAFRGLWKRQR